MSYVNFVIFQEVLYNEAAKSEKDFMDSGYVGNMPHSNQQQEETPSKYQILIVYVSSIISTILFWFRAEVIEHLWWSHIRS